MNTLGGTGLWDEEDGFYYDQLHVDGQSHRRCASARIVGLIPLFAVEVLDDEMIGGLPGFRKRLDWFLDHRRDLASHISYMETQTAARPAAVACWPSPRRPRLERVLRYVLDENEFLSPFGIRSLSQYHQDHPYVFRCSGQEYRVRLRAGRVGLELLRRQLQLARADLVPGQLPAHRGPGALPPLLRRQR